MENGLEKNLTGLVTQGGQIAGGITEHATMMDWGLNTAPNIRAEIATLVDVIAAVGGARTELSKRYATVRRVLTESRLFLVAARDSFKTELGNHHHVRWNETGLIGSLLILRDEGSVLPLLHSFKVFMENHPGLELPSRNITAVRAEQFHSALKAAGNAVSFQISVVQQLMQDRKVAVKKLRLRLRGTINMLKQVLDPMDPRWCAFGLNQPGVKAKSEPPKNVRVQEIAPNTMSVDWEASPRAEHYRVWIKVEGVDEVMRLGGSPADLDFMFENIPSNAVLEVAVSAMNSSGESALSESVTVQAG